WNMSGDGVVVARVASRQNVFPYTKIGLMIRDGLTAGSINAMLNLYSTSGDLEFQWRTVTNGDSAKTVGSTVGPPYWLKLVRQGNTITAFASPNGITWSQVGSALQLTLGPAVYIGLAVSSANGANVTTAVFDNVTVGNTANDFYVAAMPGRQTVTTSGGTARYQLVVNSVNGTTGAVSFTASGLPPGASSIFIPYFAGDGAAATLQLTVPAGLSTGTYSPRAIASNGNLSHTLPLTLTVIDSAAGVLPDTWLNENIADSTAGTGTTYSNGAFTVQGAGSDIWGSVDQFQFAYQSMKGDDSIMCRVEC